MNIFLLSKIGILNLQGCKSKLQKLNRLTYSELRANISNVIKKITKDKYINIIKGAYKREQYVKKISNRTKKIKGYL